MQLTTHRIDMPRSRLVGHAASRMKAWIYRDYGGPEVLELAEVDTPVPGRGELRLRVRAFALNPLDWKLRSGEFRVMTRGGLPRGVGYDVAGIVDAAGPRTTLRPGEAVVGMINPYGSRLGAAAEYACVREENAVAIPPSLSAVDAAALPGAGLTALQALRKARVRAGQRALIVGASGGVGSFAVLLSLLEGLHVTAVASRDGQEHLRRLGPQRVIDRSIEDWRKVSERFDLVFDCTGSSTYAECRHLLAGKGVYANTLPNGAMYLAALWARLSSSRRVIPVIERPVRADLQRLVALAADDRLRPPVTRIASMDEVPELELDLEAWRGRGKFVVQVAAA